jgi:hypothetical protein
MRTGSSFISGARHIVGVATRAFLIVAMVAALGAGSVLASKGGNTGGWITVGSGAGATAPSAPVDSHFVASGCGFRANGSDYFLVVRGPAPDTASLAYWVDPFPADGNGCGSTTPSWTSSGIDGTFDVYVVRSPSGSPWQAQPASNIVTVNIVNS